jgi:4a-hydroxytetrahydrobiopterin dehydratase
VFHGEQNGNEVLVMSDWPTVDKALARTFVFSDFVEAMTFVDDVAKVAEEAGHHPDIAISWNKVTLRLWDHHKDAITDQDRTLAATIDALPSARSADD